MKNVIIISEEDRNNLQRAHAECESRMNIITYILQGNIKIDENRFLDYQKDYTEKYMIFETEKSNLEQKYLKNLNYNNWNLNYSNCELSYE